LRDIPSCRYNDCNCFSTDEVVFENDSSISSMDIEPPSAEGNRLDNNDNLALLDIFTVSVAVLYPEGADESGSDCDIFFGLKFTGCAYCGDIIPLTIVDLLLGLK
jgi:hypothetical protein